MVPAAALRCPSPSVQRPVPPIDGANCKIGHFLRPETENCHAQCHGEVAAACRARAETLEQPPKVRVAESLWKPTELGVSDDWNCATKRADVDAAYFQKAQYIQFHFPNPSSTGPNPPPDEITACHMNDTGLGQ